MSDPFDARSREAREAFWEGACRKGWEGIIAKEARSPYVHSRSRSWLKLQCVGRQELVGGTGFDDDTLEALRGHMDRLERKTPPFADDEDLPRKDVHWITPKLVAEVAFPEWTDDLRLRHPRFEGLRRDKDPGDVTREAPR